MKKADVRIGDTYIAKVSNKRTLVRITREADSKGWFATNVATGREVRILTAARLSPRAVLGQGER